MNTYLLCHICGYIYTQYSDEADTPTVICPRCQVDANFGYIDAVREVCLNCRHSEVDETFRDESFVICNRESDWKYTRIYSYCDDWESRDDGDAR
jgi:hypothetical protein